MKILVTGCAGFIGYSFCKKILDSKRYTIFGVDNLNSYYDVKLKKSRLTILKKNNKNFFFTKLDIKNQKKLINFFKKNKFDIVVHLAAQAGVRHSIHNPKTYFDNNVFGFFNILEACKSIKVKNLIYASTSSVYGNVNKFPIKETANTDKPLSFYAATKKTNEVLAYSYSNIYKLRTTGLRFFTVYGPYGRPDMALFKFVKNIILKKEINLYNYGKHTRDFTYIDDVVSFIIGIIEKKNVKKELIPYTVFNIGNGKPIHLKNFLRLIENKLKIKSKIINLPFQIGDVKKTHANVKKINSIIKFKKTEVKSGITNFINWYTDYFNIRKED